MSLLFIILLIVPLSFSAKKKSAEDILRHWAMRGRKKDFFDQIVDLYEECISFIDESEEPTDNFKYSDVKIIALKEKDITVSSNVDHACEFTVININDYRKLNKVKQEYKKVS